MKRFVRAAVSVEYRNEKSEGTGGIAGICSGIYCCASRAILLAVGKDMSDLCDKVREDPKFRRAEAKRMGVGFAVRKSLKTAKAKPDRFVVRRVVRDSHEKPQK
jgi:hypothetical protein